MRLDQQPCLLNISVTNATGSATLFTEHQRNKWLNSKFEQHKLQAVTPAASKENPTIYGEQVVQTVTPAASTENPTIYGEQVVQAVTPAASKENPTIYEEQVVQAGTPAASKENPTIWRAGSTGLLQAAITAAINKFNLGPKYSGKKSAF